MTATTHSQTGPNAGWGKPFSEPDGGWYKPFCESDPGRNRPFSEPDGGYRPPFTEPDRKLMAWGQLGYLSSKSGWRIP